MGVAWNQVLHETEFIRIPMFLGHKSVALLTVNLPISTKISNKFHHKNLQHITHKKL
jgi:hypothetical protein